jgi:glutathione S-transferase kappa 1
MKVEFFYDIVSVYTYYAFEILERYKSAWNLTIIYRPFFLGGVMVGANNKPPATVPAKGTCIQKRKKRV